MYYIISMAMYIYILGYIYGYDCKHAIILLILAFHILRILIKTQKDFPVKENLNLVSITSLAAMRLCRTSVP